MNFKKSIYYKDSGYYKDKAYFKLYKIGNFRAGRFLHILNWLNLGLLVLNLFIRDYTSTFYLSAMFAVNIFIYIKARNLFCKNIENEIIRKAINKKLNEFKVKNPDIPEDKFMYEYLKTTTAEADLSYVFGIVEDFYKNL